MPSHPGRYSVAPAIHDPPTRSITENESLISPKSTAGLEDARGAASRGASRGTNYFADTVEVGVGAIRTLLTGHAAVVCCRRTGVRNAVLVVGEGGDSLVAVC
jgi:hypothetical protein